MEKDFDIQNQNVIIACVITSFTFIHFCALAPCPKTYPNVQCCSWPVRVRGVGTAPCPVVQPLCSNSAVWPLGREG